MSGAELILTGERTLPGIEAENYWFRRHEAAYLAAAEWLRGAGRVLEAGVGEGYGAALLSGTGAQVAAVDYDATTAAHVAAAYPKIHMVRGNVVALPFGDAEFDAVVSMQVIEHLWDQAAHIAECARVLRPGGRLVLSTPNRLTFSPGQQPDEKPTNPFHTREFSDPELADLIGRRLTVRHRHGLHAGPRLRALDAECLQRYAADLVGAQLTTLPDQWPDHLRQAVKSITAADFTVTGDDVDEALDLIVLATRRP